MVDAERNGSEQHQPRGVSSVRAPSLPPCPSSLIDRRRYQDKSQADDLDKFLVCLQTRFFISLLELNTFAHAIYALFIYLLWS